MKDSRESKLLITVLKRCLKNRGLTYKELAEQMNLSESSIKRLLATNSLSMQRFEQICEILGMSIFEISKMAREESGETDPHILTLEQEQALADNAQLFIGFHLVLNGWGFEQITNAFDWTEPEVIKVLTTLDKLRLISLQPNNLVKTLTANNIRWRKDGAIRKRYEKMVFADFLNHDFKAEQQFLDFELLELSQVSINILHRKLEQLLKEVNELAAMDYSLKQSEKKSIGMILGMRPWFFNLALDSMKEEYVKDRVKFHKELGN